mmetsp:Transcript_1796/g.3143  ORF Transcript_1796/g.3143 Transcript_1796/m.3143 type:complete len:419 (-) Transcript_1796:241-1497(-)|eukprot:CAMPEP_0177796004 /NCGR_PEP_ID=MMETSP0491_2-20121128/26545_1 /TAXON_ID=63592 /ORGANISM="Tetraselmis chuii, Strain PLY429" /LENGTH=418 /DNA_ID=CAMNT_0019318893 /DNA_START=447 /DNA_END=1703 /DNA_ORIENTATION=-
MQSPQSPVTYSVPAPAPVTKDFARMTSTPPTGSHVAAAYAVPLEQKKAEASRLLRVSLVASDCLLIGLQPILVHLSKDETGHFAFNPVSVNFLTELAKCIFAICLLMYLGTGRPGKPMYRSARSFISDAHHNILLMVPAGLYAMNNYLKFLMQLYFKPTTTKMLGNLKVFVIALLLKFLMKRQFSVLQWEALFLLVAGITINQLSSCPSGDAGSSLAPAAILYTGLSVTVPAAASVYNEIALKKHMDTSVHLQNFFMYFYGALFNITGLLLVTVLEEKSLGSMFSGQNTFTVLLVMNNAAQGILSSFFFKYADTILKKYSSTVATIFTGIMSMAMFNHPITLNFMIGVSIVFISMHQFFTFTKAKDAPATVPAGPGLGMRYQHGSMDHMMMYEKGTNAVANVDVISGAEHAKKRLLPR